MQKTNAVPPGHSGKRRLSSTAISLALAALGVLGGKMSTQAAPFINVASDRLPPFISQYVSPAQFHAIYAATGVRLTNVSHSFFDRNASPPPPNGQNTHSFGSSVSMYVSTDFGATYSHVKAPAAVTVKVVHGGVNGSTSFYNTEMLQLDISGGGLPPGVMVRESPTLASTGQTRISTQPANMRAIDSFFDIFTEVSLNGGTSWTPADAVVHVEMTGPADEWYAPNNDLPPPNGNYVSPEDYHQAYANGIIIRNIDHKGFLSEGHPGGTNGPGPFDPPPPGGSGVHQFLSTVSGEIMLPNSTSFQPFSTPNVFVSVQVDANPAADNDANTRFFDTEMQTLHIAGGNLPAGVMLRESPTKASTGKTSIRRVPQGAMIASFFDIFTEISLDGGQTWSPSIGPARVGLRTPNPTPIPTLSQWGMIVLALLLLTLGTIYIRRQQPAMAFATVGSTQSHRHAPLFTASVFAKTLIATLALAAAGCVGAVLWFGSIAPRDVAGTLVSAVIAAYWAHLLIAARKDDAPRHE